MQTVDVHSQAIRQMYDSVQAKKLDWNENPHEAEKADAEPVRNGDSFPAMIEKMIAADKEVKRGQIKKISAEQPVQKETGMLNFGEPEELQKNGKTGIDSTLQKNELQNGDNFFDGLKAVKNPVKKALSNEGKLTTTSKEAGGEITNGLLSDFAESFDIKTFLPEDLAAHEKVPLTEKFEFLADSENLKNAGKKKSSLFKNAVSDDAGILLSGQQIYKDAIQAKLNKKEQAEKNNTVTEESRKTKKPTQKQSRPVISVEDLRSGQSAAAHTSVYEAGTEQRVETDNSVDMVIDFSGKTHTTVQAGETISQSSAGLQGEAQKTPQSFSAMLAQEIRESSADFVQAGKIVLRDNNAGEIRLQLRPENLGAVKIKLELSGGKKVVGTVTVETKEAFEAFEENLDGLSQAFKQSGFEAADFNLNWSGSSSQESFARNFETFNESMYQNAGQNLSSTEKIADTLSTYSYVYGTAVNILV